MTRDEARAAAARIAKERAARHAADPWEALLEVRPLSRPLLVGAVIAPSVMDVLAGLALYVSTGVAALGAKRMGLAGATLAHVVRDFVGVRARARSRRNALGGLRRFLNETDAGALGSVGRASKCVADIVADHHAVHVAAARYGAHRGTPHGLLRDSIQNIGFQMMIAYRVMRLWRDLHVPVLARVASRTIRHVYGAELHWDAELAPGVLIVHGTGLVLSHAARVGPGCVLSQNVTLGESIHPDTHDVGAPYLERDVHVAPGAMLFGPITVGRGTKVAANAVVTRSVAPMCVVESPTSTVRARKANGRHQAPRAPTHAALPASLPASRHTTPNGTLHATSPMTDAAMSAGIGTP